MDGADFLSRLNGVQGRGPHYRAICPGHDSKNRTKSLAIRIAEDGRILLKCHAGCDAWQIVGALGLELSDLFPPRVDDRERGKRFSKPFPPAQAFQEVAPSLVGVWAVLKKVEQQQRLTTEERAALGKWSEKIQQLVAAI